jgi:hypothetical protein
VPFACGFQHNPGRSTGFGANEIDRTHAVKQEKPEPGIAAVASFAIRADQFRGCPFVFRQ